MFFIIEADCVPSEVEAKTKEVNNQAHNSTKQSHAAAPWYMKLTLGWCENNEMNHDRGSGVARGYYDDQTCGH